MNHDRDVLVKIGAITVMSQTVANVLQTLSIYVIQDGTPLTLDRLLELERNQQKASLGFFIREMQKRADFDPWIGDALERFLGNRNKLIHHYAEIPGGELSSDGEALQMHSFLDQLLRDIDSILTFCMALLHAWSEQTGIAKGKFAEHYSGEHQASLDSIECLSKRINELIFAKS